MNPAPILVPGPSDSARKMFRGVTQTLNERRYESRPNTEPVRVLSAPSEACARVDRQPPSFQALKLVYHSTLGLRVIKKKKKKSPPPAGPESCILITRVRQN